jgi:hypothetical protein
MRHAFYIPRFDVATSMLRASLAKDKRRCRETFGRGVKDVKRRALEDDIFKTVLAELDGNTGFGNSLEGIVFLEEFLWREEGRHVYFPVPGLLPALAESHLEIDTDDLHAPVTNFLVAPVLGEPVYGEPLPGFMVMIASPAEKCRRAAALGRRLADAEVGLLSDYSGDAETGIGLFFVMINAEQQVCRCAVPSEKLGALLTDDNTRTEDQLLQDVVGNFHNGIEVQDLTPHERVTMLRAIRITVRMLAYMRAFPGSVHDGYPEGYSDERKLRDPKPTVIGGLHFKHGTHAGPVLHFRNAHFRSYPRRRDGGKREGMIFIHGTMVGGQIKPHSVDGVATNKKED